MSVSPPFRLFLTVSTYSVLHCRTVGTIVPRKRKNGTIGYTGQIVIKRKGVIVHREAKTFDQQQAASAWLNVERPNFRCQEVERAKTSGVTLDNVIDRYIKESPKVLPLQIRLVPPGFQSLSWRRENKQRVKTNDESRGSANHQRVRSGDVTGLGLRLIHQRCFGGSHTSSGFGSGVSSGE